MPVIANPADPSYCNFGRDGVELCTPAWYREGPEATWLAEGTLASQLENEGTRQWKEARARYRSSQSADPCGNLRFPLSRPQRDLDPSRGMGLRAVVHADMCCARPLRLSCCLLFLWPSAPDWGGGRWGGFRGRARSPAFPRARLQRAYLYTRIFDEAVCGGRRAGHALRSAYCASRGVECETKPCLICILPALFPIQATTTGGGGGYDQQQLPWVQFVLVFVVRRWRRQGPVCFFPSSWTRPGGRCATRIEPSQRKLSLSSRDDTNYKDIHAVPGAAHRYALMRSRATFPGASLPSGKCLPAGPGLRHVSSQGTAAGGENR